MTRTSAFGWIVLLAWCGFGLGAAKAADRNLLKNGDFEKRKSASLPQSWEAFAKDRNQWFGSLSKEDASQGKTSVAFVNAPKVVEYQGIFQTLRVKSGERYEFSVFVALNPDNPLVGSSRGQLSIEWYDAQGHELGRPWSQAWGRNISKDKWTRFAMNQVAPDRAAKANFVITLFSEGDTSGSFLVDDAVVVKTD